MPPLVPSEQQAAIAAIGQGQLQQIRILVDDIYARFDALEEKSTQEVPAVPVQEQKNFSSIEPAVAPEYDAKAADVREAVINLTEKVNEILETLKG